MLWRNVSIEPQRFTPRGETAMPVAAKGFDGLAGRRISGFDRDMGGCRG